MFLEVILKQTEIIILILLLILLLTVIWIAVSLSVFYTYWNVYLLLALWNLKVLAKLRRNLRQYLHVCFFSHHSFIYTRKTRHFLIDFVSLYSLTGSSSHRCAFIKLKACNQFQFFTLDFIYICDELASFHFSFLFKLYTISKFKRINKKSFHRILLILSGDISLNSGPVCNSQSSCSNEWNVFKAKGIHLIHLNVDRLLPKTGKIWYTAARTNAVVIRISESKLDETILQSKTQISNYELLRCDRNRNGGFVACYSRSDIGNLQKQFFPKEIEDIFVEILLPKTKLLIIGIIYSPPNQNNFLEIINAIYGQIRYRYESVVYTRWF